MNHILAGQRVLVVGCGVSGVSAARYLAPVGAQVTITDEGSSVDLSWAYQAGIEVQLGGYRSESFLNADLIVVSPEVDLGHHFFALAREKGIPIATESDLAFMLLEEPVIVVTGISGKTMTANLIRQMLHAAGKSTFSGGSLGAPLTQYLQEGKKADYVIAEISSQELPLIKRLTPRLAVLTQIPDVDLDRYRVFLEQCDYLTQLVMSLEAPALARISHKSPGPVLWYAKKNPADLVGPLLEDFRGAYFEPRRGCLVAELESVAHEFNLGKSSSFSESDREGILAAVCAALSLGVGPAAIQAVINELHERLKGHAGAEAPSANAPL